MKFLIFFILLIFISGCGTQVVEKYNRSGTMELLGAGCIDIYLENGDISIESSENDKLFYSGTIEVMGKSKEIIEKAKDEEIFVQAVVGSSMILRMSNPLKNEKLKINGKLLLKIPENLDIRIKTQNGDVVMKDMNCNNVSIKLKSGNLKMENVTSAFINSDVYSGNSRIIDVNSTYNLKNVNGNIYIKPILEFKTINKITMFKGNLEMEVEPDSSVRFITDIRNGNLKSDFDKKGDNLYISGGGISQFKINLIGGNAILEKGK